MRPGQIKRQTAGQYAHQNQQQRRVSSIVLLQTARQGRIRVAVRWRQRWDLRQRETQLPRIICSASLRHCAAGNVISKACLTHHRGSSDERAFHALIAVSFLPCGHHLIPRRTGHHRHRFRPIFHVRVTRRRVTVTHRHKVDRSRADVTEPAAVAGRTDVGLSRRAFQQRETSSRRRFLVGGGGLRPWWISPILRGPVGRGTAGAEGATWVLEAFM